MTSFLLQPFFSWPFVLGRFSGLCDHMVSVATASVSYFQSVLMGHYMSCNSCCCPLKYIVASHCVGCQCAHQLCLSMCGSYCGHHHHVRADRKLRVWVSVCLRSLHVLEAHLISASCIVKDCCKGAPPNFHKRCFVLSQFVPAPSSPFYLCAHTCITCYADVRSG